ncbi:hypothetical protein CAPTEDRAFT_212299 [Capitella teleta]|uniref:Uncharacterized protein n=1 Tax=Capitella teleta TaxID=283909 RepID=R7UJ29_CAPTE|nr:hypothetical protein CAPTEDRAFT_212299 [Capitella teleta]|eukprot:ELU03297.1 hypothetical protein CAPTEDRAFT_212299 [Capitella teleta]
MNAKERSSGSFLSGIMRRPKGKKRERPKSCNLDLSVEEDAATPQGFWRSASSRWSMMRRSKSQTNVNKGEKKYEAQRSSMGCFIEETEWEPFVRRDIRGDPRGCITPIANTAYGLEYSCNHNVTNGVMISKAAAAKDVMISHSCEDKVGLASLNGAARQSAGLTKTAADTSKATVKSCHAKKEVSKAAQPTHTLHYDVKESTVKQLKRERTPPEDAQLEELDDVQSPDDVHLDILALCEKYSPVAKDAVSTEAELLPPADSQDSGFQEVPNPPTSTLEDKDARSMEDTQCPIAASLSFPSEDSDDDSDSFYRKVVVRKSRSYHDLVRKRSRSKSRSSQMESSGGSHDMKWRMMRSYDSSSAGFSDLHSPHANALVVSDRSRKQSMPPPQTVVLRRAGSLDSVSTAGDVKQRDLNQLQRRSMVVPDAVDYDAVCVQPTRRTRMGRHSKSTGNVPAASRRKQKNGKNS